MLILHYRKLQNSMHHSLVLKDVVLVFLLSAHSNILLLTFNHKCGYAFIFWFFMHLHKNYNFTPITASAILNLWWTQHLEIISSKLLLLLCVRFTQLVIDRQVNVCPHNTYQRLHEQTFDFHSPTYLSQGKNSYSFRDSLAAFTVEFHFFSIKHN